MIFAFLLHLSNIYYMTNKYIYFHTLRAYLMASPYSCHINWLARAEWCLLNKIIGFPFWFRFLYALHIIGSLMPRLMDLYLLYSEKQRR